MGEKWGNVEMVKWEMEKSRENHEQSKRNP